MLLGVKELSIGLLNLKAFIVLIRDLICACIWDHMKIIFGIKIRMGGKFDQGWVFRFLL